MFLWLADFKQCTADVDFQQRKRSCGLFLLFPPPFLTCLISVPPQQEKPQANQRPPSVCGAERRHRPAPLVGWQGSGRELEAARLLETITKSPKALDISVLENRRRNFPEKKIQFSRSLPQPKRCVLKPALCTMSV